ncbi:MAG: hypothetical protein ACK48V_05855 [Crocinitomicaceae bacterium]|jgi:hypothetical protein
MEIKFTTKEESKKEQEAAFLKLSKSERFILFLKLSKIFNQMSTKRVYDFKNNFVIDFTNNDK